MLMFLLRTVLIKDDDDGEDVDGGGRVFMFVLHDIYICASVFGCKRWRRICGWKRMSGKMLKAGGSGLAS